MDRKRATYRTKMDDHLDGKEPSLGIIPIKDDNTCTWGAIDIDVPMMDLITKN